MDYSLPKLYIPKDKNGKPTVEKPWYIWFNFRNPATKKFDNKSKFKFRDQINTYKTVKERKAYGKNAVKAYTEMLKDGLNPFENQIKRGFILQQTEMNMRDALQMAFQQKSNELAAKTIGDWKSRLKTFLDFADTAQFSHLNINEVTTFHVASFLNHIAATQSGKSVNNFRGCLSALWGKLANDLVATSNPVTVLKKRKENPKLNKPFTPAEVKQIKDYLEIHDPYLLTYIRFIAFSFLRVTEVARLTVGNIDLENSRMFVKTKSGEFETVRVVKKLAADIEKMRLENFDKTDFLMTVENKPSQWKNGQTGNRAKENYRTKVFSDRFREVKKHFGFGNEYGLYSFRHSAALDLHKQFIDEGLSTAETELKMLPITRHRSLTGLRKYLRNVGAMMPKDFGDKFTLDL